MIELQHLEKSFGDHHVLKDVSATFERGKVNFVIGRSGSGKSVMTKCTVGLIEPDQGRVFYDGRDFTSMSQKERKVSGRKSGCFFKDQPCSIA